MKKIAVIGLGYVGLPLAILAEEKGFEVIGIDLNKNKIDMLNNRESPIDDLVVKKLLNVSKITFTNDFSDLEDTNIAIICVPTPVDKNKIPNISIVKSASVNAAKFLKNGSLLIIESTVNPGVCDEVIIPAIESETTHKIGNTLGIAHCPERINPGDSKWNVGNINRVIGANSNESLDKAYKFYSELLEAKIKKMVSLKEAEAVKVVENSFRDINIAFVNELAMSFNKLGINVNNVIDGAATKPFAFMAHYPGIGVGGHCIPVDPYYLIEYAKDNGFEHKFLSLARNINENMPIYALDKLEQSFIELGLGNLESKKICVLGLSYKANVGDDRESPSYIIIKNLISRGSEVTVFDPHLLDKSDFKTLNDAIKGKDAIVLATNHDEFSVLPTIISDIKIFFDGRNMHEDSLGVFYDKGIKYLGI